MSSTDACALFPCVNRSPFYRYRPRLFLPRWRRKHRTRQFNKEY